jgi:hypothetical protein
MTKQTTTRTEALEARRAEIVREHGSFEAWVLSMQAAAHAREIAQVVRDRQRARCAAR